MIGTNSFALQAHLIQRHLMGRSCELRSISDTDAQEFLQYPEKLVQLEADEYQRAEEAYERTGNIASYLGPADSPRRFYDWRMLVILVSCSHTAWHMIVNEGEQVGKDAWSLGFDAQIFRAPQVLKLSTALASALAEMPESPAAAPEVLLSPDGWEFFDMDNSLPFTWDEDSSRPTSEKQGPAPTERQMQQELQHFIQETAAANRALLLLG
ncbi:hypothetical protein [Hymenobacter cellulosivorans]|uniref:DUF1877 family protein n=1 Tax=Hymenobacter cellulosivorans TaxID=2932249 RepID=A0ABY4FB30_9BACT|nr:hypothetical protein [Hymenobacter cellulosivorans]UOQ53222.1 hypothetical protein MUN80_00325 [Hymenobacter cellulosivorans]